MPCHVRSTSVSSHRRRAPLRPPAAPLAVLDLGKPAERQAHDYIFQATAGTRPSWRVLDMRRLGERLLCAVAWTRRLDIPTPYAVVEINVAESSGLALHWQKFATADAARAELAGRDLSAAPQEVGHA